MQRDDVAHVAEVTSLPPGLASAVREERNSSGSPVEELRRLSEIIEVKKRRA